MPSDHEVREQVKDLLLDHQGASDPITSREINREVGLDNVGSFPSTRAVIREIVLEDQIPIAASSNGYYVLEEADELEAYLDNLESRIMGLTERRLAIKRAVQEWDDDIVDDDSDLL